MKRTFYTSDAKMLLKALVLHKHFEKDEALFVQFDAGFAPPFAANFWQEIQIAYGMEAHYAERGDVRSETAKLNKVMQIHRKNYRFFKYFVEKAFPEQPAMWNKFGFKEYAKICKKPSEFSDFLQRMYETALAYSAAFAAVGFGAGQIAEVAQWAAEVERSYIAQQALKQARPAATQKRIAQLNKVWETVQRIRKAGKLIFQDNFAKQALYITS